MAATRRNTARIELRPPRETKLRWEQAAELAGASSVASFIKLAVTERADAVLREHDALALTGAESAWLQAFLGEPTREPTPAVRRADQRHRSLFGHD